MPSLLSGVVSSATDSTISWNGEKVLEMLRKTKLSYTHKKIKKPYPG
jgi:hypothetical protein